MAALSKLEFLKRYMSSDEKGEKKKKSRKNKSDSTKNRYKVLDDDVDFKTLLPSNLQNTLDDDIGDNEPVIAGVIDERPEIVQQMEKYRQNDQWKSLHAVEKSIPKSNTRHDSDSDQSPSRVQRHDYESDQSPARLQRHDSESDQSPARLQRHDSESDQSPARLQRHDSESDQSPPRKHLKNSSVITSSNKQSDRTERTRHDSDSDQSPHRKQRHDSDSDQSPVRLRHDSDQLPPRRKTSSNQSNSTKHKHNSDPDQSPPRRQTSSNQSNSTRHKHNSDSDQAPIRNRKSSDSDQSPPRKQNKKDTSDSPHRKHSKHKSRFADLGDNNVDDKGRSSHTLGGATAGLSTAQQMKHEATLLRKKQDRQFNQIDSELLGKDAKTVLRDKSGRRRDMAAEQAEKDATDAKKAELDAKYNQWGQGVKQSEEANARASDAIHEASKPLARYRDDSDLDTMMREMQRDGDPMLAFMKAKPKDDAKATPKYQGNAPPNRFGIRPGYRWDGVDRSNGFEKKLFTVQSDKKAVSMDAYKWSTEDM